MNSKKKLSLKKAQVKKQSKPVAQANTIMSMFQKQADQQEKMQLGKHTESEGSEGDVVITKVVKSDSGNILSDPTHISLSVQSSEGRPERILPNKSISKVSRLSLTKEGKRKSKICIQYDSSDDEFTDTQRSFKEKYANHRVKVNSSLIKSSKYNLRHRKSEPIILESDSDDIENGENNKKFSRSKSNIETCSSGASITEHKVSSRNKHILSRRNCKSEISSAPRESSQILAKGINKDKRKCSQTDIVDKDTGMSLSPKTRKLESRKASTDDMPNNNACSFTEVLNSVNTQTAVDCHNSSSGTTLKGNNVEEKSSSDTLDSKNTYEKPETISRTFNLKLRQAGSVATSLKPHRPESKRKPKADPQPSTSKENVALDKTEDDNFSDSCRLDAADSGEVVANSEAAEDEETTYRVPYYLENFRTIIDCVLQYEENARLFNEADKRFISTFNELDEPAQKLYVRIFSRKLSWLPMNKLNYPDISDNIHGLVDTLTDKGLLTLGDELTDLKVALSIISAPDLKSLAKSFHLNITGVTKPRIVEMLMKKSQQSAISAMFKGGTAVSTEKTMLNRAKSYLGKICRLEEEARAVFIRLLMLFSLYHTNYDEESGGGGQNQLFQMLMANIGRVVYPVYTVNWQSPVFQDRESLIRFEKALQSEVDLHSKIERGKWLAAYDVYKQAKEVAAKILQDKQLLDWDTDLPDFLRLYTAGAVYTRLDNQGVEILQRLKKYHDAVTLLQDLLAQRVYCTDYRGHWYERLALNLDAHLKEPSQSLDVIKEGLDDPLVRVARRLALYQRAEKLCGGPNSKFTHRMVEFQHDVVCPAPEHYVEGMVMPDATSMGIKYQFVMSGGEDGVTLCGVEELVLDYYKGHGFPEGLHAEGSIISNLFCLFFWEVMFMDVPNVFHGPYQTQPLDMASTDFYVSRKAAIDERLEWLDKATEEELQAEVGTVWENHSGMMCAGINWDKFSGPQTHQGLVSCMGGHVISRMLERYVKNPRHTRSGFPDLTLWNTETKALKISEVKGPNDRLSHKQILWLDYLLKQGVDAEVCFVKAVGSKKLKPTAK